MKREGHWKDWAKSILEKRMDDQLRRPKAKKTTTKKKGGKDKKEEDNDLKPPEHFDLSPLNEAYLKFISVGAEMRTIFRDEILDKEKKVLMLFCDENGQMIDDRTIDLNVLGKMMNDHGITVNPQISHNMSSLLETFGGISYDERVVQVQEKIEEKKALAKKDVAPKIVSITQKLVSYADFKFSLQQIRTFDIELSKLGYLKNNPTLDEEVKVLKQEEEERLAEEEEKNKRVWDFGEYEEVVNLITND